MGTIVTPLGRLVFNTSYENVITNTPFLNKKFVIETTATYKSGFYSDLPIVKISILALDDIHETRVLTIYH